MLFESFRWSYVINSKHRSAICEVPHSGLFQDTQPAPSHEWNLRKSTWMMEMGKLLGTYRGHVENHGFLSIFPIAPISRAGARPSRRLKTPRDRQRLYRCTPTSWLNLRPLGRDVGGFFVYLALHGFTLQYIFGMNDMKRDYHNDGKSYEHL